MKVLVVTEVIGAAPGLGVQSASVRFGLVDLPKGQVPEYLGQVNLPKPDAQSIEAWLNNVQAMNKRK